MPWKVSTEFDRDNDGVGLVTCDYFNVVTDTIPSFSYAARVDTKIQAEYRDVLRAAVRARRKTIARIAKQNLIIPTMESFINTFEEGFVYDGNG